MQLQSRGGTEVTVSANQSPAMGRVQEGLGKGENNNWGSVPIRWMVDLGGPLSPQS